jgi:predicted MPP superfamily phosphohydrolase
VPPRAEEDCPLTGRRLPELAGQRRRLLHTALLATGVVSRIPPLLISPALAGLAAISAWPWQQPSLQGVAGALTLLAIVGDGVSLALLPRLKRSFGPVTPSLLALALLRAALTLSLGALWASWSALGLTVALQLALTGVQVYASWIEPFRFTVSHLEVISPRLRGAVPLRVLQVSDVHFEGWTPREEELVVRVRNLAPDLVLLTGDYLNLSSVDDRAAHDGVRDLLASLAAIAPTYAIAGSPPVDPPDVVPRIFAGLPITWLLDDTVDLSLKGHRLRLAGLRCTREREQDGARLRQILPAGAGETFTVLLYHSPDLMPEAVDAGIDLYLAGHTHGGQLRLPLFGALITSSDFWKRYEAGLYQEGATTLYVSRGVGMEGMGAPRARLLAPPELVLLTLCAQERRP